MIWQVVVSAKNAGRRTPPVAGSKLSREAPGTWFGVGVARDVFAMSVRTGILTDIWFGVGAGWGWKLMTFDR